MRVELMIDRTKKLPDGSLPAREAEKSRRIGQNYEGCKLIVPRVSADGLSVTGGANGDEKRVEQILQETWESADDWFY